MSNELVKYLTDTNGRLLKENIRLRQQLEVALKRKVCSCKEKASNKPAEGLSHPRHTHL